jgi:hypothetical protein
MKVLVKLASQEAPKNLDLTSTDSFKQFQSQVHAINVLRAILADKDLCNDIEEFLVDITKVTLEGYKSPRYVKLYHYLGL